MIHLDDLDREVGLAPKWGRVGDMAIEKQSEFIVYGKVRGLVARTDFRDDARGIQAQDRIGCAMQGGYSDAHIYRWNGDWEVTL